MKEAEEFRMALIALIIMVVVLLISLGIAIGILITENNYVTQY